MATQEELLADFAASFDQEEAPEAPLGVLDPNFRPSLNPSQQEMYDDEDSRYILAHGERGSGKSIGMLHKIVKHAYNEYNALILVVVGIKRSALEGGAWHKLVYDVLPQWGAHGLMFTESKTNTAKDDYIQIYNKYGSWSRVVLVSMPVDGFVRERVRGMEPSLIFVDEATTLQSDVYFSALVQQLGRRPNIRSKQQYLAATNPDSTRSWVYRRFFIIPKDNEAGTWNPDYKTVHVPISENIKNLPDGYYEMVEEALRDDPIEFRRLVLGEWVDRPSGTSIFSTEFNPAVHVKGDYNKDIRIKPRVGQNIFVGYDLGTSCSGIVFMQNLQTKDKDIWTVFDEIGYNDVQIPYPDLVPAILRRMEFWNKHMETKFNFIHISDASAWSHFRAADGSFDALDVERISTEVIGDFPSLIPIRLTSCPKPPGSVLARVKLTKRLLQQERLFISASCLKVRDSFEHLESEKMNDNKYSPDLPFTPKRSKFLHIFDALSYVLLANELDYARQFFSNRAPPEMIAIGSR